MFLPVCDQLCVSVCNCESFFTMKPVVTDLALLYLHKEQVYLYRAAMICHIV